MNQLKHQKRSEMGGGGGEHSIEVPKGEGPASMGGLAALVPVRSKRMVTRRTGWYRE